MNSRTTQAAAPDTGTRGRTVRASRPLAGWRTVDILTIAFLGVAFGIAYWGYSFAYEAPAKALGSAFPPLQGLTGGPWLVAGIVGGLVARRPGAAFACELIAALVEAVPGSQWGASTFVSGALEGLGAELVYAVLGYAAFGFLVAALAGAVAAAGESVYEWSVYWTDWGMGYKWAYLAFFAVSGAVVAGVGGRLLTSALARAGALNPFPPGQELRESRAV